MRSEQDFTQSKLSALRAVGLAIIINVGFWIALSILVDTWVQDAGNSLQLFIEGLLDLFSIVFTILIVHRLYELTKAELGLRWRNPGANLLIGVVIGLLAILAAELLDKILTPLIPNWLRIPREYDFVGIYKQAEGGAKILLFIAFAILTPIVEEVFYRGLVVGLLRRAFSVSASVLISSCLFGFVHVFPSLLITAVIVGLGLGLARELGKSVVGPIFAHFIFNCYFLVVAL